LEELVEIAGGDGEEFEAFEQRQLVAQRLLGAAAGHKEVDIEVLTLAWRYKKLTDARQAVECHGTANAGVSGHIAPTQHIEPTRLKLTG
jgi:phage terminase Nu1 subunit (DNA packaging protein)